jgi:hypothetical protein
MIFLFNEDAFNIYYEPPSRPFIFIFKDQVSLILRIGDFDMILILTSFSIVLLDY